MRELAEEEGAGGAENVNTDNFGNYESKEWENGELNVCPSCGAEIVSDGLTAVTKCPFCSNTAFIKKNLSGIYKPDSVVPFEISLEEATDALCRFAKRKPLLPKNFINEIKRTDTQGLYVPYWLYDCDSEAHITYRATRVHTWQDSRYIYTKTDHYFVVRDGSMSFDMIPADGSSKMDDDIMEAIEPYDKGKLTDFDSAYLSGFLADKYDVTAEDNRERVCSRVSSTVRSEFLSTVMGYSSVRRSSEKIVINDKRIRYALLPVWVLDYNYKGKRYTYTVNGQSGRVAGALPVSWGRFFAWLAGISAGVGALLSLCIGFA